MALNKIDPTKIIKICSVLDSAIDKEATGKKNFEKYEDCYDTSLLKYKEGEFPTLFHIQNILSSDEAKIKQDHMKIEFPELKNKTPDELKKMDMKNIRPKVEQVKTQEMMVRYFNFAIKVAEEKGKTFPITADIFEYAIVQEMGSFIMMRTQIGDALKNA